MYYADECLYLRKYLKYRDMRKYLFITGLLFAMSVSSSIMCQDKLDPAIIYLYQKSLEEFCTEHYKDCFTDRTYVEKSLIVEGYEATEEGDLKVYKITGKHSYKGKYGTVYNNMAFIAHYKYSRKEQKTNLTFQKRAKADFFHSQDYWEECSYVFNYK